MTMEKLSIAEMYARNARWRGEIRLEIAENRLVVSSILGKSDAEGGGLCASAGPPCSLLVVADARRDIQADDCFQISQINADFHCRGTT